MNDEDNGRDNLYARAEKISAELGIMTLELKSCIDNVNSRAGGQGEASDPLSKIVHILNNQLQALSNVDDGSEQVTKRLEQLTGTCIIGVTVFVPHRSKRCITCCGHILDYAFAGQSGTLSCCQKQRLVSFTGQSAQWHLEFLRQANRC